MSGLPAQRDRVNFPALIKLEPFQILLLHIYAVKKCISISAILWTSFIYSALDCKREEKPISALQSAYPFNRFQMSPGRLPVQ